MDMSGKELIRLLKRNGWKEVRIEGSHHIMKNEAKEISVPVHGNKSMKKGLLSAILKEAELE